MSNWLTVSFVTIYYKCFKYNIIIEIEFPIVKLVKVLLFVSIGSYLIFFFWVCQKITLSASAQSWSNLID